ncbi:MAG: Tfp pilus assembly protein FimT/FimU [Candidatus Paceibacterota bacterium]
MKKAGLEKKNQKPVLFERGVTLIEILIVLTLLGIVFSLLLSTFSDLGSYRSLERDAAEVKSLLEEARIYTQGSREDSSYGVYFEGDEIALFKGGSWDTREAELERYQLQRGSDISLDGIGGEQEIVFDRLSGELDVTGDISISGNDRDIVITLLKSGLVE